MEEPAPAPQSAPVAAATAAPVPRSIGERLRAGRERAGLSLPAAAEKLHLDPKVIEALEADRFAELGASVYVRGHLRRYGDFVGEAGAELVNLYSARDARPPAPDLTQVPQAERRSDPRHLVSPLVGLGSAAVLAGAIWWFVSGPGSGGSSAKPAASSEATSLPSAADSAMTPGPAPATVPPAQPTSAALPAAVVPAATAAGAATPAERREETPVRPTQLTLQLASESWIEIYDSRGERLFFDIASAGSVQSVEGRPPLRVVLGYAAGVAVQVNGEPRDIPAAAVDGEGARFVVNRSGTLSRSRN